MEHICLKCILIYTFLFLVFCYCIFLLFLFDNNDRINPYNRYKIFYSSSEKKFYCKNIRHWLFPFYITVKYCIPIGFEDFHYSTLYFDTKEEAIETMQVEYEDFKNLKSNKKDRRVL